jgi:hypothetical protein
MAKTEAESRQVETVQAMAENRQVETVQAMAENRQVETAQAMAKTEAENRQVETETEQSQRLPWTVGSYSSCCWCRLLSNR